MFGGLIKVMCSEPGCNKEWRFCRGRCKNRKDAPVDAAPKKRPKSVKVSKADASKFCNICGAGRLPNGMCGSKPCRQKTFGKGVK